METIYTFDNSNDDKTRDDFAIVLVISGNQIINFGGTCKKCHFDKVKIHTLQNGDIHVFCPSCKSNDVIIPASTWAKCFGTNIPRE